VYVCDLHFELIDDVFLGNKKGMKFIIKTIKIPVLIDKFLFLATVGVKNRTFDCE